MSKRRRRNTVETRSKHGRNTVAKRIIIRFVRRVGGARSSKPPVGRVGFDLLFQGGLQVQQRVPIVRGEMQRKPKFTAMGDAFVHMHAFVPSKDIHQFVGAPQCLVQPQQHRHFRVLAHRFFLHHKRHGRRLHGTSIELGISQGFENAFDPGLRGEQFRLKNNRSSVKRRSSVKKKKQCQEHKL